MYRTSLPIKPIDTSKFFVVTCISNPCRFRTRYDLYRRFAKYVADSGVQLMTVEVAYGDRVFEVTEPGNPWHIQLRTGHELWHKENMLNLGISRLPSDWEYVAWVDSDISWMRPDWVQETVHQLQHYQLVQMWSTAHDLGPDLEPFKTYNSFVSCYHKSVNLLFGKPEDIEEYGPKSRKKKIRYDKKRNLYIDMLDSRPSWHTGYAWAARREAIDHLGGLIDWAILGSGDRSMALALIGEVAKSAPDSIHPRYLEELKEWEARAERHIKRNIGFVQGGIVHYYHGSKVNRRYTDRWKVLIDHQFDPTYDIKRDSQGLWQLTDRNFKLRDDLRFYFRQRNEDSIDMY